ncbi:uncharacterized protein LOC111400477 [Olea europaea var. sylvestris]|uniref:uncharacterized protein LOC111400477 n=1 Tax=Olea europaea var. sylvestris TaxID=158386 RepID=UPI000C1D044E|nr:uncharacterized protein LOC111400477 [Olea europaea var. sylvestris]
MKLGESVTDYLGRVMVVAKVAQARNQPCPTDQPHSQTYASRTELNDGSNILASLHGERESSLLVHEQKFRKVGGDEQALKVSYEDKTGRQGRARGGFRGSGVMRGRGRGRGLNKYECPQWEKAANYAEIDEDEKLLLMAFVEENKSSREGVWFLDSGCSNHMTRNKQWFTEFDKDYRHSVTVGNNMRMAMMGKGCVKIQVGDANIGQLQEKGLAILIQDGSCKVYHTTRGLIM